MKLADFSILIVKITKQLEINDFNRKIYIGVHPEKS